MGSISLLNQANNVGLAWPGPGRIYCLDGSGQAKFFKIQPGQETWPGRHQARLAALNVILNNNIIIIIKKQNKIKQIYYYVQHLNDRKWKQVMIVFIELFNVVFICVLNYHLNK